MKKIYVVHRDHMEIEVAEYETDEEREEIYEAYDDSPWLCGTLFLTEDEFNLIRKWKDEKAK